MHLSSITVKDTFLLTLILVDQISKVDGFASYITIIVPSIDF